MWAALGLALALAMDATAVAAARGIARHARRDLLLLPLAFGGFQSGMAAIGLLVGREGSGAFAPWDWIISLVLLAGLGAKMCFEAWRGGGKSADGDDDDDGGIVVILGLALATSIDAAAAGLALPALDVDPALTIALIGGVTAALSAIGWLLGKAMAGRLGAGLEALGGLVLIGLATKIALEHILY